MVAKSQVVTKFNVTKSRLHCTTYYHYLALCLFPIANRMLTTSGTMTRTTLQKVITFGKFKDSKSKDIQID